MADWYVGQRVVCVSSKWKIDNPEIWGIMPPDQPTPIPGVIYTIREVVLFPEGVWFSLEEFPDPLEVWVSTKFRPVDERDADLSELATGRVPGKVDA